MRNRSCALFIVALLAASLAWAAKPTQRLEGVVTRVVDGDTFWLALPGESAARVVRIEGIDAPERCQDGGPQATQALSDLALNRTVNVRTRGVDPYDRVLGKAFIGEIDLGDRLVRDGQAWSLRYRNGRGTYAASERLAQTLRRGLHGRADALLPRVFRRQFGPCP